MYCLMQASGAVDCGIGPIRLLAKWDIKGNLNEALVLLRSVLHLLVVCINCCLGFFVLSVVFFAPVKWLAGNSGLCWTVFARNRDTAQSAVPAEGNGDLQTLICVLVARPRRCLTLSNPVPWQNWMAAYLGYTLRMKTLFCGWPVMVNDSHTRRKIRSNNVTATTTVKLLHKYREVLSIEKDRWNRRVLGYITFLTWPK